MLGLRTVGQVLSHVQRENRLVVNVLLDGRQPDLTRLGHLRASLLEGHTLFVETAEPRQAALEALGEVDAQLREADRLRAEAVDCLHRDEAAHAMERLSGCFSTWHHCAGVGQQNRPAAADRLGVGSKSAARPSPT